jgi:septal ring factor EnvC (AmiA/AmiB activator)
LTLLLRLTFSHLPPASVLVADALQGRIAELTAELEGQKKETARLQGVETEMSKTVRDLHAEMTAMKAAHVEEIAAVTAASDALSNERDAAVAIRSTLRAERDKAVSDRDAVRRDRDEHIALYEKLEKDTAAEAQRLTRRAQAYCDALSELDRLVSGTSSPILRLSLFSCSLS